MRKFKFRGIVFEDVVLKEADGLNDWSQVCQGCVEAHRLATGEDMRLNEYPMEGDICGIDGCDTPADFYIDFAENALVNMKVVVGRHINGIGLNSLEYLLDDDGTITYFESEYEAREFLKNKGLTEEDIYWLTFEVVEAAEGD